MFEKIVLSLSFVLLASAVISSIVCTIMLLLKKDHKVGTRIWQIGYSVGILTFFIAISDTFATFCSYFSIVPFAMVPVVFISFIVMSIRGTMKKWQWLFLPVLIVFSFWFISFSYKLKDAEIRARYENSEINEIEIQVEVDFEVKDGDTPIEVLTSSGYDANYSFQLYRYVYDEADLDLALPHKSVTADDCIAAIKNSATIDEKFKPYIIDYTERIARKYPEASFRIFYNNLKTLEVKEVPQFEYIQKSWSATSLGCYRLDENIIYIPKGTDYTEEEGNFSGQVLIHEFCHAFRGSWFEEDGLKTHLTFESNIAYDLLTEAMNSVFSCSLLNYYEWDIAYQVPSNYLRIMLECMDNYELTDYINHGDTYFFSKLDETTGHTNYASVIWKLIALQRKDYTDDDIDIPAERYYPIYDYICKMYYDKYITGDMDDAAQKEIADELVKKAFFDAPETYKVDEQYIYDYLNKNY